MAEKQCALLDHFAILIQILLGAIAFSTLIYKRHRERPQRPVLVWLFDVSKQMIGACVMHGLNLLASYIAGKSEEEDTNPCVWYFLNIFLDCTIGVFILFVILKVIHMGIAALGVQGMHSGEYGFPPKWAWWFKQLAVFILSLFGMKIVVVLLLRFGPFFFTIGEFALSWTLQDTKLQVVFVLLIFPLIMNIVQFWVVDQVIKKRFDHVKLHNRDAFNDEDDVFLPRGYSMDEETHYTGESRRGSHAISLTTTTFAARPSLGSDDKEDVHIVQETGDQSVLRSKEHHTT